MKVVYTPELIEDFKLCMNDPAYFMRNVASTIQYDELALQAMDANRFIMTNTDAMTGPLYLLYRANFFEYEASAILAPTHKEAIALLKTLVSICEILPGHLRPNFVEKYQYKGHVEFENGSKIVATSAASDATQGMALSNIYLDSFARVPWEVADLFFQDKFPCITYGARSRVIINRGYTFYDKLWNDGSNGFTKLNVQP